MARKKHHHKKHTTHRRSRRVGAIHAGGMMGNLELLGGLVIGSMAGTIIQRQLTTINHKIVGLIQMGAGLYLSKRPSPLLAGAGYGLASAGAISFVHDIGLIHGIEDVMSGVTGGSEFNYMNGMSNGNTLSGGLDNDTMMSGLENSDTLSGMDNGTTLSGDQPAPDPDRVTYVSTMGF